MQHHKMRCNIILQLSFPLAQNLKNKYIFYDLQCNQLHGVNSIAVTK